MIVLLYFSGPGKLYFGVNPNLTSGIFYLYTHVLGHSVPHHITGWSVLSLQC